LQAAIEVLEEVLKRHQPAPMALANWGRAHRFAGSGDRAAIGNLVYDALRQRNSMAARMQADTPRALAFAAAADAFAMSRDDVAALADGAQHAPAALSEKERLGLMREADAAAPAHILGDYPEWLQASFERVFGARAATEGAALAARAPVDLRVNTLKSTMEKMHKALARHHIALAPLTPVGLRIAATKGPRKQAHVESEAAHGKGWFEVQDAGSQLAALMAGAGPRQQVADICAGSGGKTLAMAAGMHNTGQIYAYDSDRRRLRPIFERLKRAGIRNVQVLDGGDEQALRALAGRFDVVLVDAPCSGTGTWRRRPDAKWRLKPGNIAERQREQQAVLRLAAPLLKPGGRLSYVTCSVLAEENSDQVAWFLAENPDFSILPYAAVWAQHLPGAPPLSADGREDSLLLTPASHDVDGFFIAVFERRQKP